MVYKGLRRRILGVLCTVVAMTACECAARVFGSVQPTGSKSVQDDMRQAAQANMDLAQLVLLGQANFVEVPGSQCDGYVAPHPPGPRGCGIAIEKLRLPSGKLPLPGDLIFVIETSNQVSLSSVTALIASPDDKILFSVSSEFKESPATQFLLAFNDSAAAAAAQEFVSGNYIFIEALTSDPKEVIHVKIGLRADAKQ